MHGIQTKILASNGLELKTRKCQRNLDDFKLTDDEDEIIDVCGWAEPYKVNQLLSHMILETDYDSGEKLTSDESMLEWDDEDDQTNLAIDRMPPIYSEYEKQQQLSRQPIAKIFYDNIEKVSINSSFNDDDESRLVVDWISPKMNGDVSRHDSVGDSNDRAVPSTNHVYNDPAAIRRPLPVVTQDEQMKADRSNELLNKHSSIAKEVHYQPYGRMNEVMPNYNGYYGHRGGISAPHVQRSRLSIGGTSRRSAFSPHVRTEPVIQSIPVKSTLGTVQPAYRNQLHVEHSSDNSPKRTFRPSAKQPQSSYQPRSCSDSTLATNWDMQYPPLQFGFGTLQNVYNVHQQPINFSRYPSQENYPMVKYSTQKTDRAYRHPPYSMKIPSPPKPPATAIRPKVVPLVYHPTISKIQRRTTSHCEDLRKVTGSARRQHIQNSSKIFNQLSAVSAPKACQNIPQRQIISQYEKSPEKLCHARREPTTVISLLDDPIEEIPSSSGTTDKQDGNSQATVISLLDEDGEKIDTRDLSEKTFAVISLLEESTGSVEEISDSGGKTVNADLVKHNSNAVSQIMQETVGQQQVNSVPVVTDRYSGHQSPAQRCKNKGSICSSGHRLQGPADQHPNIVKDPVIQPTNHNASEHLPVHKFIRAPTNSTPSRAIPEQLDWDSGNSEGHRLAVAELQRFHSFIQQQLAVQKCANNNGPASPQLRNILTQYPTNVKKRPGELLNREQQTPRKRSRHFDPTEINSNGSKQLRVTGHMHMNDRFAVGQQLPVPIEQYSDMTRKSEEDRLNHANSSKQPIHKKREPIDPTGRNLNVSEGPRESYFSTQHHINQSLIHSKSQQFTKTTPRRKITDTHESVESTEQPTVKIEISSPTKSLTTDDVQSGSHTVENSKIPDRLTESPANLKGSEGWHPPRPEEEQLAAAMLRGLPEIDELFNLNSIVENPSPTEPHNPSPNVDKQPKQDAMNEIQSRKRSNSDPNNHSKHLRRLSKTKKLQIASVLITLLPSRIINDMSDQQMQRLYDFAKITLDDRNAKLDEVLSENVSKFKEFKDHSNYEIDLFFHLRKSQVLSVLEQFNGQLIDKSKLIKRMENLQICPKRDYTAIAHSMMKRYDDIQQSRSTLIPHYNFAEPPQGLADYFRVLSDLEPNATSEMFNIYQMVIDGLLEQYRDSIADFLSMNLVVRKADRTAKFDEEETRKQAAFDDARNENHMPRVCSLPY